MLLVRAGVPVSADPRIQALRGDEASGTCAKALHRATASINSRPQQWQERTNTRALSGA